MLVSCWIIHLSCFITELKIHHLLSLIMQIILYIFSYYIKPYLKCYFYHSCLPKYFLVCYLYSLHTPFCLVHLSKFCCMTMTNHLLLKMKFYPSDLQQICEWEPGNTKTIVITQQSEIYCMIYVPWYSHFSVIFSWRLNFFDLWHYILSVLVFTLMVSALALWSWYLPQPGTLYCVFYSHCHSPPRYANG